MVSNTNRQAYTILERGCYMPTAFHGHSATMQLNGLAYLHDIKGVREFKKIAIPI